MKTNLDSIYKTDKKAESEGIWFDISESVGFRIKRFGGMNSPSVKAVASKHYKPFAKMVAAGTLSAEKEQDIMTRTFVESCVVDWKGIEIDGQEKEFNTEDCVKILNDMPDLCQTLIEYASEFSHFKEDLGNS